MPIDCRDAMNIGIGQPLDHLLDDGLGFDLIVTPTFAASVDAVNLAPGDRARSRVGRRERDQAATVVAVVGESDQAFVPAAVMPGQAVLRHPSADAFIQNAFQILVRVVITGACATVEEAGGWHLSRIACNDHLFAASDGAHRIPWGNLRGLIENDQIEQLMIGRQVLRDRQRTHQHAGGQNGEVLTHFLGQLTYRLVAALLLQLVLEDAETRFAW